jgi:CubicO group peptidase (beta-lactamase class C family)
MRRIAVVALALISLGAAPAPTPTPAPSDPRTSVDALFKDYDRTDAPGCALGVYRDGKILYARGYGMANLELSAAITPQTVFDIGSTSKQFTAFAIHLLARDGKLSLDDDIRKWVPEIPDYGKTVTIRHLLHHTGGLRDYIVLLELQGVLVEDLTDDDDVLEVMSTQKAPNFPPGQEHLYSNTGYFLLSVIVKRASGKSLRDFAAERVFGPLGMRHTQFNDSHTRIIPNRATGYSKGDGGGFGIDMSDWEQTGDGAVLTTVEDLQRWDENFFQPVVGDKALIEAMQQTGVLNSGKKLQYASALYLTTYRGLDTVSHGGAWAGYRAQLLRFPKQHFSVACLCNNGGTANPSRLAYQVSEVYLGSLMKPAEAEAPAKTDALKYGVSVQELRRLAGAYRNPESGEVLELGVWANKLGGEIRGRKFTLEPTAPGHFRVEGLRGGRRTVVFGDGASGARPPMELTTVDEDEDVEKETFEPVTLWKPNASDLASLAGTYSSKELSTTWKLKAEGGRLFIRHRGAPKDPLKPTVADAFTVDGLSLKFQRDPGKGLTGFLLDAGRVRGILFTRVP